ncbi:hypothetical protein V3423_03170 [Pseudomonas aeruginosa]|uniref:hypothetical protein n=1 Tax=Pseudomonas aeruginosa TaxID=287 RepID=UPI002F423F63
MSNNIERFDRLAGKIFADLYESFPVPLVMDHVKYTSVILDDYVDQDSPDSAPDAIQAKQFYLWSRQWLAMSGFIHIIRATDEDDEDKAVLTNQALEALKIAPSALAGNSSLGDQLAHAAKEGVTDQVRSITGQILGAGLRFGLSAMQNI